MRWSLFIQAGLVLATAMLLITALSGVFAYDCGVYIQVEGLVVSGVLKDQPRAAVFSVKIERALGPDRTLFSSGNAGQAWAFYTAYREANKLAQFAGRMPWQP